MGASDLPDLPGLPEFPEVIDGAGGVQLRRLPSDLAAEVEGYVLAHTTEAERAEMFRYYTRSVFPLTDFVAAPGRSTYGLFSGERFVGQTSIYDANADTSHVTLGFTYVLPGERGKGYNPLLKQLLFAELAQRGVRGVWFRMDAENEASRRGVERAGAVFSHVDEAPRVYPDGRVGESLYFFRRLVPVDWVFAASNGFAVRVQDARELRELVGMALEAGPAAGLEWVQVQHAQEEGVYVACDAVAGVDSASGSVGTRDSATPEGVLWRLAAEGLELQGSEQPAPADEVLRALDRLL